MAEYTEQMLDREVRISRYTDGSFASATARDRVQLLTEGAKPFGSPEWREVTLTRDELATLLGEAAVAQREALEAANTNHIAKRNEWATEKQAMEEAYAASVQALQARIAELEAR